MFGLKPAGRLADNQFPEQASQDPDHVGCKFCGHTPIEFERGVRKYQARIGKLIVMWEAAESKATHNQQGYDPARQATPEQLARWQAAAYGYAQQDPYCDPYSNSSM